jgi:hypothetical protein
MNQKRKVAVGGTSGTRRQGGGDVGWSVKGVRGQGAARGAESSDAREKSRSRAAHEPTTLGGRASAHR